MSGTSAGHVTRILFLLIMKKLVRKHLMNHISTMFCCVIFLLRLLKFRFNDRYHTLKNRRENFILIIPGTMPLHATGLLVDSSCIVRTLRTKMLPERNLINHRQLSFDILINISCFQTRSHMCNPLSDCHFIFSGNTRMWQKSYYLQSNTMSRQMRYACT